MFNTSSLQIYQFIQYIYYIMVTFYYKLMLCSKFIYSAILCYSKLLLLLLLLVEGNEQKEMGK